jgi:hypothetical protein
VERLKTVTWVKAKLNPLSPQVTTSPKMARPKTNVANRVCSATTTLRGKLDGRLARHKPQPTSFDPKRVLSGFHEMRSNHKSI